MRPLGFPVCCSSAGHALLSSLTNCDLSPASEGELVTKAKPSETLQDGNKCSLPWTSTAHVFTSFHSFVSYGSWMYYMTARKQQLQNMESIATRQGGRGLWEHTAGTRDTPVLPQAAGLGWLSACRSPGLGYFNCICTPSTSAQCLACSRHAFEFLYQ